MITKATKLLRLLVCVMLAFVLLVSILPMQVFAAQETEASNEIDVYDITIENLPEILKAEFDWDYECFCDFTADNLYHSDTVYFAVSID